MDKQCKVLDVNHVLTDIHSADEHVRASAVRSLCPCRSGWGPFEEHLHLIKALCKDPSPLVRKAALHLFEDAGEMQSEGLTTNPHEATNEMLRTRRASRFLQFEGAPPQLWINSLALTKRRPRSRMLRTSPGRASAVPMPRPLTCRCSVR